MTHMYKRIMFVLAVLATIVTTMAVVGSASATLPSSYKAGINKGCVGSDYSSNNLSYCSCWTNHIVKMVTLSQIITWEAAGLPHKGTMWNKAMVAALACVK